MDDLNHAEKTRQMRKIKGPPRPLACFCRDLCPMLTKGKKGQGRGDPHPTTRR